MDDESLFPNLPTHWERTTLGAACEQDGGGIQTGPFGSQLHASDYVEVGIPSIMPKNIGDNRIIEEDIARIRPEDARRLSRYLVQEDDIVYSRRGDVEKRALVRAHEDGWLCGTGCLRVRFGNTDVDPVYASYYLGHPSVREWIVRHAHGATMPNLNTSILSACPFVVPPLPEQRAIAHVLGTLDDKIELNRRMNATLEGMARALFKSWFVDFDPVRAKMEGRPTGLPPALDALFPDALVESALGEIPVGWDTGTLGDVGSNKRSSIKPEDMNEDTPYIGLQHMPQKSIALTEWETADGVESNKYAFRKGDILFGKLRPYFHKVGIAPVNGVCSTDILVITPKSSTWFGFLLGHVSSTELVDHATAVSTGTRMPRAKWSDLAAYPVVLPFSAIAEAYTDSIRQLTDRMLLGIFEARALSRLRDALLPRLVSGELRVLELHDEQV